MDDPEIAEIVAKVGEPHHRIDWEARKARVKTLRGAGFSYGQIAEYLGVSVGTVQYWEKRRDARRKRQAARSGWPY